MEMKSPPRITFASPGEELQWSQEMPCVFNSALCGNDNYEQMLFIHCQSHLLCEWCQHHECTVEWRETEGQREKRNTTNQYYEIFSQCYVLVFDYTNRIDLKDFINILTGNNSKPKVYFCFYTYIKFTERMQNKFSNQACNVHFVHAHYQIKYTLKVCIRLYAYAEH